KIQRNISTLITILIVSSIIYFPINFILETPSFHVVNILTGTYSHLWFIGSLIVGYLFIWYLYLIRVNRLLPYLSVLILVIAILTDSYDLIFAKNIDFELFRFLMSIPLLY